MQFMANAAYDVSVDEGPSRVAIAYGKSDLGMISNPTYGH